MPLDIPLCPECGEWWSGRSEWCSFDHPVSKYFEVVMIRGLTKHNNINKQVENANYIARCVQEAMESSTWAEVFAAVSARYDLCQVTVTPFIAITQDEAERFEAKQGGGIVNWFQRQPKAVTAKGNPDAAQNQNTVL